MTGMAKECAGCQAEGLDTQLNQGLDTQLSQAVCGVQVNVEYLQVDSRTFTTDDEGALSTMFGDGSDENPESGAAIKRTAARLATVFATLKVGSLPDLATSITVQRTLVVCMTDAQSERLSPAVQVAVIYASAAELTADTAEELRGCDRQCHSALTQY